MTNLIYFFIFLLSVSAIKAQDKKGKDPIQFCNTENQIFLDSLGKCAKLVSADPTLKIMSYQIKFEVSNKLEKKFNVLGDALTPEIIKLFKEYYKSINDVYIEVTAEKDSRFIKLPSMRFMFLW